MSSFAMRNPCPKCDTPDGIIETVNGQDTVRCAWCTAFCYNAPKTETGRGIRSLSQRPNIKPRLRKEIFLRDGGSCIICRSIDRPEVGHLISIADGAKYGIEFDLLHSDENLAVMCATCNNGISDETVPIRLIVKAFMVRHYRKQPGTGEQVQTQKGSN
jgi:5-methylcytosine-specific restriction endonuclease McrA